MKGIPIIIFVVCTLVAAGKVQATIVEFYDDWIIQEGDQYDEVYIYGDATIGVTGGSVGDLYAKESSTVNLFDGMVYLLGASDSSTVYIYGGQIKLALSVRGSSVASLFGSTINTISILDSGIVRIYGTGFQWERSGGGAESGCLSGCWLDGTGLTIYFRDLPEPFPGSHVALIPEPCTFLLLSLGGFILRRRNSSGSIRC